jgi:hypothetical protein
MQIKKNGKIHLLLIFVFILNINLTADEAKDKILKKDVSRRFSITVSYFGEFFITHPGFTLGFEFDIFINKKDYYKVITAVNLGFYAHPYNSCDLFFDTQIGNRFTAPVGYFSDIFIGIGYLHSWPLGTIYSGVNSNGELMTKINSGFPHLYINVGLTLFGWDFSRKTKLPLSMMIRIFAFGEYPYNQMILPHSAV